MKKRKQIMINMISNIFSFIIQFGISLILTPIITEKIGVEAYGFIGLSNNFVSYATIFTALINSIASRFVTYELSKGNEEKANEYYSSVFIMNIIFSIIIIIATIILIANITIFLDVPYNLVNDVKITFILAFLNLILSSITTVYTVTSFVKNRLDLDARRNIIANIAKAIFIIFIFVLFVPKIYYISLATLMFTIIISVISIYDTKKIAPELKISKKYFNIQAVKTLVKSGVWNSINGLGKILLTGIDLLISNIFLGPTATGLLSIAKTIPTTIETVMVTMANSFAPQFIMLFSKENKEELIKEVKFAMKIIAYIMIIPIIGFVVFGNEFLTLWLPSKTNSDITTIQILSILSMFPYVISVSNFPLYILDTTTNKLKRPVVVTLIISILSTITTLLLLKYTTLGIYAVAGVSSIYWVLKVVFFNTINAAINLKEKWNSFVNVFIKNILCTISIFVLFIAIKDCLILNTWKNFVISVTITGLIGYVVLIPLIFNKKEIVIIIKKIKEKYKNIIKKKVK